MFQSGAILIYLAEEFGELSPDKGEERYEVIQWLMLEVSAIGPTFGQHLHFTRFEPNVSDYARERDTSQSIRLLDVVEQRLQERKYLCDEQYSIADMAAFAWLGRLRASNFHMRVARISFAGVRILLPGLLLSAWSSLRASTSRSNG